MPEFRDETELQDTGQDGLQRFRKPLLYPEELSGSRSSELISNSTSANASKNAYFKGRLETVSPSESTELQRKRRSRERIWELAAFHGAEVGLRMLQIPRVFSWQNRDREPFARGWWRREWDSNPRYG